MVDKSKMNILRTALKHPKLSKVVSVAFDAPIGSTKRAQALAVLDSIYKVSGRRFQEDGKGGEEGTNNTNNIEKYLPYLQKNKEQQYDRMMIFNAAPKMKSREDGQGGDGLSILSAGNSQYPGLLNTQNKPLWGPGSSKTENINLKLNPTTGQLYDPSDILKGYNLQQAERPLQQQEGLSISQQPSYNVRVGKETPKSIFPGLATPRVDLQIKEPTLAEKMERYLKGDTSFDSILPKTRRDAGTGMTFFGGTEEERYAPAVSALEEMFQTKKPEPKKTTKKPLWGPELDGYKVKGAPPKGTVYGPPAPVIDTTTVAQERANAMYQKYIDAGFSPEEAKNAVEGYVGISPTVIEKEAPTGEVTTPSQYSNLDELARKTVGPESYYGRIQVLPIEERRKLFPGIPDELLPMTTTDIRDALEKETKLKEWEDKQKQLAMQGNYLVPDMKEYIRNRDEYISDIDKSISNTMYKISHLRTGDPREEKDLRDNLIYLNILKGRQSQRYVDFLQTSLNSFSKEKDRVNMMYQQAKDDFEKRFTLSLENQQNMKNMLIERWKYINKLNDPAVLQEQEYKNAQIQKIQAETLETLDKISGSAYNSDVLKQIPMNDKYFTDTKTGALKPSSILDIPKEVSFLIKYGQNPDGIAESISNGIDLRINELSQDFPSLYKEIKGLSGQLYNLGKNQTLNETVDASGNKIDGGIFAGNLMMRLLNKSKSAFTGYLHDKRNVIAAAIKDLTPGDWFYQLPSKESWAKKFADQGLEKSLLEDIYDYYMYAKNYMYPNDPEKSRAVFTGIQNGNPVKKIDDSNIDFVIKRIYKGIADTNYLKYYGLTLPEE